MCIGHAHVALSQDSLRLYARYTVAEINSIGGLRVLGLYHSLDEAPTKAEDRVRDQNQWRVS